MIVVILFVFMVAMFIINFNRQQIKKHTDRLEDRENQNKDKDNA
jgi:preprotein translocase subunit YajC